eukprot:TRINITY_DN32916_c0_g2_i1.p1 TRINITY_DN32916_c0_g2~~TRINITY_DN32916_c0_g2_i1.p1  ORF type:complete len:658 (+),score=97.27 TRINITY_DN32916_c0_g2_i1:103-2076(+)
MSPVWRKTVPPPPTATATVVHWKQHPRLQKHLRRFYENADQASVLARYHSQASNFEPKQLLRATVHVAAWVALLPLHEATKCYKTLDGKSQPSPVRLLAEMLKLRGRARVTEWLRGALHLVALRLREACLGIASNLKAEDLEEWRHLRQSLPKSIWRELRTETPSVPMTIDNMDDPEVDQAPSSGKKRDSQQLTNSAAMPETYNDVDNPELDEAPFSEKKQKIQHLTAIQSGHEVDQMAHAKSGWTKFVRRFHRQAESFLNSSLEEQADFVRKLESQLKEAVASESWNDLCSLLRDCTAALTKPRQKPAGISSSFFETADANQSCSSDLQSKLRKILFAGFVCLDLADSGTLLMLEPAWSVLRSLISHFEESHASSISEAMSGQQWMRLKSMLFENGNIDCQTAVVEPEKPILPPASRKTLVHREDSAKWGSTVNGIYTPGIRIQQSPLVKAVEKSILLACDKCGLQLTSSWVFQRHGEDRVIVPMRGHFKCGGHYRALDGRSCQKDNFSHLDICPHDRIRSTCLPCGGGRRCKHGRFRHFCTQCGGASMCPHGKTRIYCIDCGGSGLCVHQKRKYDCKTCKGQSRKYRKPSYQTSQNSRVENIERTSNGHECVKLALAAASAADVTVTAAVAVIDCRQYQTLSLLQALHSSTSSTL